MGGNGGVSVRYQDDIMLALPWMDPLSADYICLSDATLRIYVTCGSEWQGQVVTANAAPCLVRTAC